MTPIAYRRMRRFAFALLGLGLSAAPWLWATLDAPPPVNTLADRTRSVADHAPLLANHALTLQGRTRSLEELFGRPAW